MSTPSETVDLCKILSEARRIIKSQAHHFQALSVLFLLPFSFAIIIYPFLQTTTSKSRPDLTVLTQILINLLYIFFVTILSICAVASISYSTFHAFYGTPVALITSIKSIFHSFFPLVSTLIIQELILALISLPFVYLAVQTYGSESFYRSNAYFIAFIILLTLVFLLILTYLQVNWILVSVIVVVESKWGLEPMRRSAQLVKGKRGVALSMILLFGLIVGAIFWGFFPHGPWSWGFIFRVMTISVYLTLVLLLSLVANAVLYVYCIEMHGEVLPYSGVKEVPLLR